MGRILIVADLEDSCIATPRGLEIAARLEQPVDVVAFTYAPLGTLNVSEREQTRMRKALLADREQKVQARIDKHRRPGQKVDLKVVWEKNIDKWITSRCARGDYIGVMKTGNRSETLVHTSTDWELLRNCKVPVLLVADKKWHKVKPVLVALDLSSSVATKKVLNRTVLDVAQKLARVLEVELEIITAIEVPTLLADLDLVDPGSYAREARKAMKPEIEKLASEFGIPESSFYCKRGPVEKVITSRAAKVRAQIVVMGTVARKGVKARLLGNTAEKVLRYLRTDVLAIKP